MEQMVESGALPNGGQPAEMPPPEISRAGERLRLAIRQARVEDAEHSRVVAELRGAEIARLEMLRDELRPVLAETPKDVDFFDLALVPSERPRLFVDMIAFVEMGHDRRQYRFLQDTRLGRVTIAESERLEAMVEAVTEYIARRLIEREKALAGDTTLARAAETQIAVQEKHAARGAPVPRPKRRNLFGLAFGFFIEFFGSAVLVALLGLGAWTAWKYLSALYWIGHRAAGH